jgi:peroxiredoxin
MMFSSTVVRQLISTACVVCTVLFFAYAANSEDAGTATVLDDADVVTEPATEADTQLGEDLALPLRDELVGRSAPAVTVTTLDGTTINLADIYGKKPVYLKFWATWCKPCREQMASFKKIYESSGNKIEIIAVNMGISDDLASVRAFKDKFDLKMPIVIDDGKIAAAFKARVTPQHAVIGRNGKFIHIGHAHNAVLAAALEESGATPETTVTTAQPFSQPDESNVRTYKVGDVVGSLQAQSVGGETIDLGQPRNGKFRGLLFFSSWCEWYLEKTRPSTAQACARARESIKKLESEEKRIEWIAISGGPWALESDLADYISKNAIQHPVARDVDGRLFRAFSVRDLPTLVIVDQTGRIVRNISAAEMDFVGAVTSVLNAMR